MTSGRSRKVAITFAVDSMLDLESIIDHISEKYEIGFAGARCRDGAPVLFLQTANKRIRMVHAKIKKLCETFARVVDVSPVDTIPGDASIERGCIRKAGRKIVQTEMATDVDMAGNRTDVTGNDNDMTINDSRQTTNNDNRQVSRQTSINLHIHALGKEDVSHITAEKLSELIGTEEQALEHAKAFFSEEYMDNIVQKRWIEFRELLRHRVSMWDKQQGNKGENALAARLDISKHSDEPERDIDGDESEISEAPVYDEDSDSEGNNARKDSLRRQYLLEANIIDFRHEFIVGFERLMYENPSNINIKAPESRGSFEYFEDQQWVPTRNGRYFDVVIRSRVSKAKDVIAELEKSGDLSDFDRTQIMGMLKEITDGDLSRKQLRKGFAVLEEACRRSVVRESANLAREMRNKLQKVGQVNGRRTKKIKRVHDPAARKYKSWDELMT